MMPEGSVIFDYDGGLWWLPAGYKAEWNDGYFAKKVVKILAIRLFMYYLCDDTYDTRIFNTIEKCERNLIRSGGRP